MDGILDSLGLLLNGIINFLDSMRFTILFDFFSVSVLDMFIGIIILALIISLFWKGGKA